MSRRILCRSAPLLAAALVVMMLMPTTAGAMESTYEDPEAATPAPSIATPPSAPLNLTADQGPGFIWLWWDHPLSQGDQLVKKYIIYRGTLPSGEGASERSWSYVGATQSYFGGSLGSKGFFNDTIDASDSTTYYYFVTAVSDSGESAHSNIASAMSSPTGAVPAAPSLTAENEGYSVSFTTALPSGPAYAPPRVYWLDRSPSSSQFPMMWYAYSGLSQTDAGMELGQAYTYTLRAMNTYGTGPAASSTVTPGGTGPLPSAPKDLTISPNSDKALSLTWAKPENPSATGFSFYDIYRSSSASGPWSPIASIEAGTYYSTSQYQDNGLINGLTYFYKMQARGPNGAGPDSNVASGAPNNETFIPRVFAYPGDGQVLLVWSYAASSGGAIVSYDIYRSTTPGGQGTTPIASGYVNERKWYDTTTENGVKYYYRIRARTATETGPLSSEVSAVPNPGSQPAPPTLVATPSQSGVKLSFAPLVYSGLMDFMYSAYATPSACDYEIWRGTSSGAETFLTAYTPPSNIFQYTDTLYTADENYYYQVRVNGMYGWSPMSNEAKGFMLPSGDAPDPITDLKATSGDAITVTWTIPYAGTQELLEYMVIRYTGEMNAGSIAFVAVIYDQPGPQTVVDRNVIGGLTYNYAVVMTGAYGSPTVSNIASANATGAQTLPGVPLDLQGTPGSTSAYLTWQKPADDGGSTITGYRVYRSTSQETGYVQIASPSGTSFSDTGLNSGTTYYYRVSAVNALGEGVRTAPVAVTPAGPVTPSGSFASSSVSGMQATLTFGSFSETVGVDQLRFVVEDITAGTMEAWTAPSTNDWVMLTNASSSPYPMPQLNNIVYRDIVNNGRIDPGDYLQLAFSTSSLPGHTYRVSMIFLATGDLINMIYFTGPSVSGNAPGPVRNLTAVAGIAQIALNWSAPLSDGGSAITGYVIYMSLSLDGPYEQDTIWPTPGILYTNLNVGVTHYYKVAAMNANGIGTFSGPVWATPADVPGAPRNLTAEASRSQVTLSWLPPSSDGYSPIIRYDIYCAFSGRNFTDVPIGSVSGGTLTFSDTAVEPAMNYRYMVKAVNAMGSGPASNVVSVSTPGPFVPDAPRNVAAANGSMKVTISWQAPDSDGGTPILGYKIWYFWNGTYFPLAAVGENVRSWTFTSTVSGDTREFFVSAFNEVGDGPNSAGVYGETLAASTDNTMLYLGGGLVLIAVVGVGLYLLMRRKK